MVSDRRWAGKTLWVGLGLYCALSACSWRAPQQKPPTTKAVEGGVALSNVVLARSDAKGQLLWKFQAQGLTYGDLQQVAKAKTIKGQLYEAGRPVFDIAAEGGTVRQTNQQVRLEGKIQVADRQHKVLFQGREAQWNPASGRLIVRNGLAVTHPQLQLWANELQASKRGREVKVTGNVLMETRTKENSEPRRMRLRADQALWAVDRDTFKAGSVSDNSQQPTVQIERIDLSKDSNPKDKALALAGEALANLKTGVVLLRSPVRLSMGSLTLTSREIAWDTQAQTLSSAELLQIQDPLRQVSVFANRGTLAQSQNLLDLQGKVEVTGLRDRARLTSDRLLWNTQNQRIEARGNVNYIQESPAFKLRGPKAVGRLEEQTIRIDGPDVVTEIVP
jgi:lipopolysaccharide assembly outer membrane protein LptD (OstA)